CQTERWAVRRSLMGGTVGKVVQGRVQKCREGETKLLLARVGVGADGAKALNTVLPYINHITELDLSYNSIGHESMMGLSRVLPSLKHLVKLDLSSTGLQPSGYKTLAIVVKRHPTLKQVEIEGDLITCACTDTCKCHMTVAPSGPKWHQVGQR
ncbi:hypothetical protein KIPB_012267, partial [Kipferlia bialata]